MEILFLADLHGDFAVLKEICDAASSFDAIGIAGDFTNFYSPQVAGSMVEDLLLKNENLMVVPGNCDLPETAEIFKEYDISLHGQGKSMGGIGFFGVGGSNPTPFNTPLEFSEEELESMLKNGYQKVSGLKTKILVCHAPPKGTVDCLSSGESAGSTAIREFLEDNQVELVVCGHIHEARGKELIGDIAVVNPGPACNGFLKASIHGKDIELELLDGF